MTRSRKISLTLAIALVAVLVCVFVLPFAARPEAQAAPPVVPDRNGWQSAYTGTYYDNLNTDLTGTAFRSELAELITDTHTTWTVYNGTSSLALNNVWPKSDVADPKNPNNGQIKWFYTGTVTSASNFGGSNGTTNREHVWAKNGKDSLTFGSGWAEAGPGADAHHLRPTECQLNSGRGNLGFDIVPQTSGNIVKQDDRTDYGTGDGLCYKSGSFFYPAKGYRGATARILFYMQVRWGDACALDFVDGPTTNNGKYIGKISTLMRWHIEEPPNEDEIYRNNIIAGIQGNRNPFIDHPEFAEMIYCYNNASYSNTLRNVVATYGSYLNDNPIVPPVGDDVPTALTLSESSVTLSEGQSRQVSVTAQPSGASNSVVWSSSDESVATVQNGLIEAKRAGVTTVTATSTLNSSVSASLTVAVTAVGVETDTSAFEAAMGEIDGKTALAERYAALADAINEYNKLTADAKGSVAQQYAALQEAVNKYNEEISAVNDDAVAATDLASQSLALGISSAFLALIAILIKKFGR